MHRQELTASLRYAMTGETGGLEDLLGRKLELPSHDDGNAVINALSKIEDRFIVERVRTWVPVLLLGGRHIQRNREPIIKLLRTFRPCRFDGYCLYGTLAIAATNHQLIADQLGETALAGKFASIAAKHRETLRDPALPFLVLLEDLEDIVPAAAPIPTTWGGFKKTAPSP